MIKYPIDIYRCLGLGLSIGKIQVPYAIHPHVIDLIDPNIGANKSPCMCKHG